MVTGELTVSFVSGHLTKAHIKCRQRICPVDDAEVGYLDRGHVVHMRGGVAAMMFAMTRLGLGKECLA